MRPRILSGLHVADAGTCGWLLPRECVRVDPLRCDQGDLDDGAENDDEDTPRDEDEDDLDDNPINDDDADWDDDDLEGEGEDDDDADDLGDGL